MRRYCGSSLVFLENNSGVVTTESKVGVESGFDLSAHSLVRIIERCTEITNYRAAKNFFGERKNKEAELCIRLSQLIEENMIKLRHVKRPEELPDLIGFRKLVCEARNAHASMQKKLNSGVYPRSAQHSLCLLGRLRCELSRAFDELIEVMLTNI